jgi:hypothetical protein
MCTDGITDCTQTSGDRQLVSRKRSRLAGDLLTRRAEPRRLRLRYPSATIKQPKKKTSDTADPNTPPRLDTGKGRGEPNLDAEVAGADDVLDLPRHKHGLELGGQVGRPVRDVQIPERQRQHHPR